MMQQTDKATPRPWGYGYHRGLDQHLVGVTLENIAIIEDRHENAAENAALIVKAVNNHDALVEALRDAAWGAHDRHDFDYAFFECPEDYCAEANAALAKAEGA